MLVRVLTFAVFWQYKVEVEVRFDFSSEIRFGERYVLTVSLVIQPKRLMWLTKQNWVFLNWGNNFLKVKQGFIVNIIVFRKEMKELHQFQSNTYVKIL